MNNHNTNYSAQQRYDIPMYMFCDVHSIMPGKALDTAQAADIARAANAINFYYSTRMQY
jgi:hypothetical protein